MPIWRCRRSQGPYNRAAMFRHVPNLLTGARLVLAVVFFVMLGFYQYEGRGGSLLLNAAFVVYAIALTTDFLDGYLARKWNVEGMFGRVVDPFVDKILVLGSFIFFAGKNFIIPDANQIPSQVHTPLFVVKTITGIAPGMVIILLARELLVTTFRGMSESAGRNFGAAWSGKVKMGLQSFTILAILVYVNSLEFLSRHPDLRTAATWLRNLSIWLTLGVTVYSGMMYVRRAVSLFRSSTTPVPLVPEPDVAPSSPVDRPIARPVARVDR